MSQVLSQIQTLKEEALGKRNRRKYQDAIDRLDAAIDIAKQACEKLGDTDSLLLKQLQAQIADCYGMQGGVYRRWDDRLDDSLQRYQKGLKYEEELGLDSYNLSNVIALSIMENGGSLPSLLPQIERGIQLVTKQVGAEEPGPRSEQWWAYADLGMFYLLKGDLQEAKREYAKFRKKGAEDRDYESTIGVLRGLHNSLSKAGSSVAEKIGSAIDYLSRARPGA